MTAPGTVGLAKQRAYAQLLAKDMTAAAKARGSDAQFRAVFVSATADSDGPGYVIERGVTGRRAWGYLAWADDIIRVASRFEFFGQVVRL